MELTKAEYERALARPQKRFRTLSLDDKRLTLQDRVAAPCYWFERNDIGQEHPSGRYLKLPYLGTITLVVDGVPSALFYLAGRKLDTCTIAYQLTPRQLDKTLRAMRQAKLARLILPAARWALQHMPDERRPILEAALRAVVHGRQSRSSHARRRRRTTR